ncbi:MAG: DUF1295 domain-containing protein, partial [Candidatus Eremiobacteraeota bacterium]|nr:DUF1295 domain-containing protein [Candidatus Eremiobacteraeota bacterium]
QEFVFRWRGGLLAPLAVVLLVGAQPTLASFGLGLGLALAGESLRLWAIGYTGEPTRGQELDAPALVTAGPYSLTRNPLYLGNLLNGLALALAAAGGHTWERAAMLVGMAACGLAFVYGSIIPLEEQFLEEKFGRAYREYKQSVAGLIPRSTRLKPGYGSFSLRRALLFERSSLIWWASIWGILWLRVGP